MSDNSYCPYCGSILKAGDAFCNNCGASVSSSTPSTPQPTSQPISQPTQTYQQTTYQNQPAYQYGTQTQTYQTTTTTTTMMNKDADNALVWGIVSLFCTIAAIPAIIFGFRGLQNPYNKNKAVIGLVLGFCVLGVAAIYLILEFVLWW